MGTTQRDGEVPDHTVGTPGSSCARSNPQTFHSHSQLILLGLRPV